MFVVVWGAREAPPSQGQHRHIVWEGTGANPVGAGAGGSNCNLQVSGHILVFSHGLGQFGCSEKPLLQFKEKNREYKVWTQADTAATSDFSPMVSLEILCLICWVCFAHGPAQVVGI